MSPPKHPWNEEQVADYIKRLFERDFMRAADRYAATEIPRLQQDAARRGIGYPRRRLCAPADVRLLLLKHFRSSAALRWGYVMNMRLDPFRTLFGKFARLS